MVSENIKSFVEEINNQVKNEGKYIELVSTVEYLINLVEPTKREQFKNALNNAENMDDVNEVLSALKLQLGAQGAKKLLSI